LIFKILNSEKLLKIVKIFYYSEEDESEEPKDLANGMNKLVRIIFIIEINVDSTAH